MAILLHGVLLKLTRRLLVNIARDPVRFHILFAMYASRNMALPKGISELWPAHFVAGVLNCDYARSGSRGFRRLLPPSPLLCR